jgi:hypothetical protein
MREYNLALYKYAISNLIQFLKLMYPLVVIKPYMYAGFNGPVIEGHI